MTSEHTYQSAQALRTALEERLNQMSRTNGSDIMRLRRQVAFDRLLARLFLGDRNDLILKGGYALELRMHNARATKDMDIAFYGNLGGIWSNGDTSNSVMLQEFLQNLVVRDVKDYFEFFIQKATLDLENAPYGGYRFPVEARMAGRTFIKFEIDIAAGDCWIEPHEMVKTGDWLAFAGIDATAVPVISIEQQFAEKLHAYTLPRESQNSRVKDLVDIVLFIETGTICREKLQIATAKTFERRKTHPIPQELPLPPELWKLPFKKMTKSCGLDIELDSAIEMVRKFYRTLDLSQGRL